MLDRFWTGRKQGRATVRNRSMRKARAAKAKLTRLLDIPPAERTRETSDEIVDLRRTIRYLVHRARFAHREWRRYDAYAHEREATATFKGFD